MAFSSLDLPNTQQALQMKELEVDQLNSLLADVHAMLLLPVKNVPGLDKAGCNFAAAAILLDVASGVSRIISRDPYEYYGSGGLLKEFLKLHYPWDEEPQQPADGLRSVTGEEAATILVEKIRNPLVHRLGTDRQDESGAECIVAKGPLRESEIEALEELSPRPFATTPTLGREVAPPNRFILDVPLLYWGLRKAIWKAVGDGVRLVAPPKPNRPAPADQRLPQTTHATTPPVTAVSSGQSFYPQR